MDRLTAMSSFVRVVECGSFTSAAAAANLSPAMIGNHVRFLENRLGEPWLNRSTRSQMLTDFGRGYYERCRRILQEVEAAESAHGADAKPSGTLRVTAPTVLGTTILPASIARYLRQNAGMKVDLVLGDNRIDLLTERMDIALRIGALSSSTMIQRALPSVPLVPCAAPDYLARRGVPATPAELAEHDCLDFSTNGPSLWRFRVGDGLQPVSVSGPARANNGQALRMLALDALGIAMPPWPLVKRDLEKGTLREVLQDYPPEPLPLHLLTLPGRMDTPKVRQFITIISEDMLRVARKEQLPTPGEPLP